MKKGGGQGIWWGYTPGGQYVMKGECESLIDRILIVLLILKKVIL